MNHALNCKIAREREWQRKISTAVNCEQIVTMALEKAGQDASLVHKKKVAKQIVHQEYQDAWNSHLKSLLMQGEYTRVMEMQETDLVWKSAIFNLPKGVLKFMLNSTLNTLPTKDNLTRWGKRLSKSCSSCGRAEYLSHVLNACPTSLKEGRYTWRHDSVLSQISALLEQVIRGSPCEIHIDLGNVAWTVPPDIIPTSSRPDLVIVNRESKTCHILELTVPYESNIDSEHTYKENKYGSLLNDIEQTGWNTQYCALEIGSRGSITKSNNDRFKSFVNRVSKDVKVKVKCKAVRGFTKDLAKVASMCSYTIFKAKDFTWNDPKPLKLSASYV